MPFEIVGEISEITTIAEGPARLLLSEAEKRNHALEHGTIHFLHAKYTPSRGIGGHALRNGFRGSGIDDPEDIRRAFHDLLSLPAEERWHVVVAKNCGSMIVIAQGIGVLMLLLAVPFFVLLAPSRGSVAAVLAAQFVVYLGLRRPLGRLVQRRRLPSLAFQDVRIRGIR